VAMVGAEIKVAFLHEVIADAAHDHGVVAIAQFGNKDAHGKVRCFRSERAKRLG